MSLQVNGTDTEYEYEEIALERVSFASRLELPFLSSPLVCLSAPLAAELGCKPPCPLQWVVTLLKASPGLATHYRPQKASIGHFRFSKARPVVWILGLVRSLRGSSKEQGFWNDSCLEPSQWRRSLIPTHSAWSHTLGSSG